MHRQAQQADSLNSPFLNISSYVHTSLQVRDDLAKTQCVDKVSKLAGKRDNPIMAAACGQLLADWAAMYPGERLGQRAATALAGSGRSSR